MKYLFSATVIFLFLSYSSQGHSREFTHFKLLKSRTVEDPSSINNILTELETEFKEKSDSIGQAEVDRITNNQGNTDGIINFSGFSWYKPMSNFEVAAKREISPEIFSDKWIVRDSFTIFIDAATLLTNLNNEGVISISEDTLKLFVGINFTRKYDYYHYANTYNEGLRSDFSKLFLSFLKFNPKELFKLQNSEIVKREDRIILKASGEAHLPITNGLSIGASASAEVVCRNTFSYQHIEATDKSTENEEARLSLEKMIRADTGLDLSLKLDFFGIIQETLFSYEIDYDFTKAGKTNLTFSKEDQQLMLSNKDSLDQLNNYIIGKNDFPQLEKHIVSTEVREKENFSSRFGFLLYGSLRSKATEQIRIVKDGVEKVFYRLNAESVTYMQSFLSRLWNSAFYKIFKWETYIAHKSEKKKNIHIEYEQINDIANRTGSERSLSVTLTQSVYLNKVTKKKHRKRAIEHLKLISKLEEDVEQSLLDRINNKKIAGPLRVNAKLQLRTMALYYFNHLEQASAYTSFFDICGVKKELYQQLLDTTKRNRIFKGKLSKSLRCSKSIIKKHTEYMEDYISHQSINIKKFKSVLAYLFKKVDSYQELTPLFGEANTFIHGNFTAKTDTGFSFQLFFKSGQFQEFGVIDRFKLK